MTLRVRGRIQFAQGKDGKSSSNANRIVELSCAEHLRYLWTIELEGSDNSKIN
jgi:hypothetical protein